MSANRDLELDYLGDEQGWDDDLRDLAHYLRAAPHQYAHVEPSPQFRQILRRRLMREAWERATRPPVPWYRRLLAPQPMAWAGAAIGAVLIVTVAFLFTLGPHESDRINVQVVSPQENAQLVPTSKPILLRFSQPMRTDTVHVQVQPAIDKSEQWDSQHQTLTITPLHGLQGNTQYQITVTAASTAQGQPVARIKPVTFSTGPVPTPTPSVSPSAPPPTPILNPRAIAPVGSAPIHWSTDGSGLVVIGPSGQLLQVPLGGGAAQKLADAATLDAVAPDGSVAWFSNGQVTWGSTVVDGVQPIALGFRQAGLLLATASAVQTSDQQRLAAFKETADAASFSPAGDRVAYHGASGLHLVDLATGRDTPVGPATALGGWAPDGRHYAYPTGGGVLVADAVAGTAARLVDQPGVTGLTWSRGNQLLLTTGGALFLVNYPDSGPASAVKLQDGTFDQPEWAPGGSGQFSFRRRGEAWVARLQGAISGGSISPATPGVSQEELVNSFMAARKDMTASQALGFLDAAGRDAFSRVTLIYSDPTTSLARYYVVLSQPGRVVVRLVLVHGTVQTAVDEALTVQQDANGHLFIHGAVQNPRARFGSGPEVVSVTVTGGQVQVVFDSDLDEASVSQAGAVTIKGVSTQVTYDSKQKTVTLAVPAGLTPGTTYELGVSSLLHDVNQRQAVPYTLSFVGPATS